MKKIIYFSIALFWYSNTILAQTPFWTETFGTGCNQGQYANGFTGSNGAWSVTNTGANDVFPNKWFVSGTEANTGVGNCGDGCLSNPLLDNRTLHVAFDLNSLSPGFYDFGAAYVAGSGYNTNSRAESPTINCTGQSNIVLSFAYMLAGVVGSDYFEVQYSADNGANWAVLSTPPPTNNAGCSGQGLWTNYTVSLPASADNNPIVKIGFRWQNVDATGADPAAAIDDITLSTSAPQPFSPTFTMASSACVNYSTVLTANTGTYSVSGYTWSSVPAAVIAAPNASATGISFGTAGTYTVSLTATSGGTTITNSNTIVINPNPVVTASSSSATCFGTCNGSATVSAGAGTFSYNFTPAGGSNTTGTAAGLCADAYTVTVTSASTGCSSSASFAITQPAPLTVSSSFTNGSCGACNGSVTFTANGGSSPYSYSVAPGGSSNNLCAGLYTITAFDSGLCSATSTVSIASTSISSSASSSSASCGTCTDGSATVTVNGGSAPLSYSWSPSGGIGAVANNLTPGCYTVTVIDNANCSSTSTTCVGFATGLETTSILSDLRIFPNPTSGLLSITSSGKNHNVMISDIFGRIIIQDKIEGNKSFDLSTYPNGVYFVRIENTVIKIIKQ